MLYNILNDVLSQPQKDYIKFDSSYTDSIIFALDDALVRGGSASISSVYWSKENPKQFNNIAYLLSELNFTESIVKSNWAELKILDTEILKYIDQVELDKYRINSRIDASMMRLDNDAKPTNLVRTCHGISETGLNRPGFAKSAKVQFSLDTETLAKYLEPIAKTVTKGIMKGLKPNKNGKRIIKKDEFYSNPANYGLVAIGALKQYIANGPDKLYNLEGNVSDSRGRASMIGGKRVFNPITYKDSRALLNLNDGVFVKHANQEQMNDIWYFIAELTGSKADTEQGKYDDGELAYHNRTLPQLDVNEHFTADMTKKQIKKEAERAEHDRKELHELIWLERIYSKLDELYASRFGGIYWTIPLEIDSGMSIMQWVAMLLNSKALAERTNIYGSQISDPWFIEGVRRKAGKSYGTPVMYGSSQSATKLLAANGMKPIGDEIKLINREFSKGDFAIMKAFKNAIIKNTNITTHWYRVQLWNDDYGVPVSKFKTAGSNPVASVIWNSKKGREQVVITHELTKVPDYKAFKTFTGTGAIHGLDSQAMDALANEFNVMSIHDAALILPGQGLPARQFMVTQLQAVRTNRKEILMKYRKSIGAIGRKADIAFMKLEQMVEQLPQDAKIETTCMK